MVWTANTTLNLTHFPQSKAQIQARYEAHRRNRNEEQRSKLLDPGFTGVTLDPILQRIHDPSIEPGYVDPRHCLVFWARPPRKTRRLIGEVQQKLLSIAPSALIDLEKGVSR